MSFFKPSLEVDLADGEELVAVATFAITTGGEIKMHMADVTGATVQLSPQQKARALRMLATGVEAEAIAAEPAREESVERPS